MCAAPGPQLASEARASGGVGGAGSACGPRAGGRGGAGRGGGGAGPRHPHAGGGRMLGEPSAPLLGSGAVASQPSQQGSQRELQPPGPHRSGGGARLWPLRGTQRKGPAHQVSLARTGVPFALRVQAISPQRLSVALGPAGAGTSGQGGAKRSDWKCEETRSASAF